MSEAFLLIDRHLILGLACWFFFHCISLYLCNKIPAFYVVFFSSLIYAMAETSANFHQTLLLVRRTLTAVPKDIFPKNSSYKVIFKTAN